MNTTTTPMIKEALNDKEGDQNTRTFVIHRPTDDFSEEMSIEVRPFLRDGSRDFDPDNPVPDSVLIDLRADDDDTRLAVTAALSPADALKLAERLVSAAAQAI